MTNRRICVKAVNIFMKNVNGNHAEIKHSTRCDIVFDQFNTTMWRVLIGDFDEIRSI